MKSLAILIPTLPERRIMFNAIRTHIEMQIGDRLVTVISDIRGKEIKIGKKRQEMLESCKADFIAFVDDDDMVSHDYIERIYEAIQQEPDVVGFNGIITVDRMNPETWSINTKYDWAENQDGFRYVRFPNHLSPIKLEHALEAGFTDMGHGEDYDYSMRLKSLGKLQKQIFVDAELYQYHYRSQK